MQDIALFPLNVVLFPGLPIRLHVFEPRYQALVAHALKHNQPFGVVLIEEGQEALGPLPVPHEVGCSAEITEIEPLGQGTMNLRAMGAKRFRIVSISQEQPFLSARVEPFSMQQEALESMEQARDSLLPWVQRYLAILADEGRMTVEITDLPKDPLRLANLSAGILQIPLHEKQHFLAMDRTSELMYSLLDVYRREIALLRAVLPRDRKQTAGSFSLN